MANQLGQSLSPYLRQHADNPVEWREWTPASLTEARERDLPIFLSVGYAACHWCHVMAHESFADAEVAALINANFVPIKVDREERPDIDAIYMSATIALTGNGGWPMTCLLTPEGDPFFAGTYFPKPQLIDLLTQASTLWQTRRSDLTQQGAEIAAHLRDSPAGGQAATVTQLHLAEAVRALESRFDRAFGGFAGSPKFPPSMVMEWLLRHHARTESPQALQMVTATADAIARGGIYDQLAGGFARYSVDARWRVPHFEKMLYDNAQLARVYAHLWRRVASPLAKRVAIETCEFIIGDLGTPEGGFAASLDADTVLADGTHIEGATYVWTPAQLVEVLGETDGPRAAELLDVTDAGSFEHGTSTLTLAHDPDDPAWWAHTRATLLAARNRRRQPARDDKVVTAWNGLAIAALAEAGALFDRPDFIDAAIAAATTTTQRHLVGRRLRRTSLGTKVSAAPGMLDDHGDLAEGLLALFQVTGDAQWLTLAGDLLDQAIAHFYDAETGTWFDTPVDGEALFIRPQTQGDNAEPSGASAIAGALLTHSALTGNPDHRALADQTIATASDIAKADPRFAGWALAQAEATLAGPLQVAIVGAGATGAELLRVARLSNSPGLVIAHGVANAPGVALLADRPLVAGQPAAYVCRGFVCDLPITDAASLAAAIG